MKDFKDLDKRNINLVEKDIRDYWDKIDILKNSDLIIWNYKVAQRKKELSAFIKNIKSSDKIKQTIVHMLNDPTKFMTVWGKLFNREIIEKNKL